MLPTKWRVGIGWSVHVIARYDSWLATWTSYFKINLSLALKVIASSNTPFFEVPCLYCNGDINLLTTSEQYKWCKHTNRYLIGCIYAWVFANVKQFKRGGGGVCWYLSDRPLTSWCFTLLALSPLIFTHLQLCLATATHNFKWVKIAHLCIIWDQTFTLLSQFISQKVSSSSTTSRELLPQFSTCSGWRWFDVGEKVKKITMYW